MWDQLLVWVRDAPPFLKYGLLGLGAAVENVFPLIPADTFVLLGGFLAAREAASAEVIFFVTWTANAFAAVAVYTAAYRYGDSFFQTRLGTYLLNPKQVEIVQRFYRRWGAAAIFYTRFLPGLRVVAPVFAGLIRQRPLSVVFPLLLASAIWYGALVWVGAFVGRNVDQLLRTQTRLNWTLAGIAGVIFVLVAWWWVRSRRSSVADTGPASGLGAHGDEPEQSSE